VGFKVFIVLVWLAVPAALACMLRADRAAYEAEGAAQRDRCLRRIDALKSNAALLEAQAASLQGVDDAPALQTWRLLWSSLERDYKQDIQPLPAAQTSHYPSTAAMLGKQDDELQDMQATVDSAERDREFYLRGEDALTDLSQQIDYLNWQSERYRLMGAEGVYLQLQDMLAQAETHYQQQQHEQDRLRDAVANGLSKGQHEAAEVQSALGLADMQLAQDERATYVDAMRQRWQAFDLKRTLSEQLTRLALGAQPGPPAGA
jgi:hypothetical protein